MSPIMPNKIRMVARPDHISSCLNRPLASSSEKNNSRSVHNRGANEGENEKPDCFLSIHAADVVKLIRKNYSKKNYSKKESGPVSRAAVCHNALIMQQNG